MIKCTPVGVEPSNMCYEICVMAKRCGALKAWEREHKNGHIEQTERKGRVMFETIPKKEVSKIICKHCLNANKYCQHHWDCPLLTEIMKFTDRKTENCSEKPNNCESKDESKSCATCKYALGDWDGESNNCERCCDTEHRFYEPKGEPQMETEIARVIVHKMIDDAVIAEDVYPDLRQKMHDAVIEYEP